MKTTIQYDRGRKRFTAFALLTAKQQRQEKPSRAAQPFILTLDGFSWICYVLVFYCAVLGMISAIILPVCGV